MSWVKKVFGGLLGKKFLVALTGLFLITFLVVHLIGNFQLFKADEGYAFNTYSVFMTTNPLIKTVSYLLYFSILAHAFVSLALTIRNKKARPVGYKKSSPGKTSIWQSRNMGILGTIILIFIVVHMKGFWYNYKWGEPPYAKYEFSETGDISKSVVPFEEATEALKYEEHVYKDLYLIVKRAFSEWWIVAFYVLSMVALSFHLTHGFQSAFRTIGINHSTYTPFIIGLGVAFSIIVPALFAVMPLYFFFFT